MKSNLSKYKVLFINPRDLSVPTPYVKTTTHAALLLENRISCNIIEPKASSLLHKNIVELIILNETKIVCISAFPSTLPDAYATIKQIKKECKNVILVLEGYMVNADPKAVKELDTDFGIYGDSEFTFLNLCKSIIDNKQIDTRMEGLIINEPILVVNKRAQINNINLLPDPAFHLLPIGKYYSASTNKKYMILFTDRGCPYNCNFCASPAQMKYRTLDTDRVVKQISHLVNELGVGWVEFMDLTFTINRKRVIEICKKIINAEINFDWACETRADLLDDELLDWMKKAGCTKITIGVESGNEALRYATGKKIKNHIFEEVFLNCKRKGIKVMANYIIGHPNETFSSAWETISSSIKLNPFNVLFTKMIPLPDVDIFKILVSKNELDPNIWYKYMKGKVPFPVYYPKEIGKLKMELIYRLAYIKFYLRFSSFMKYGHLMRDRAFFKHSIGVWLRFVFGSTIYK